MLKSFDGSSGSVDLVPALRHCIGNIINGVVFGRTYEMNDPTWIWLQHLLDEGVKQVAVAGPLNFLPILRWLLIFRKCYSWIYIYRFCYGNKSPLNILVGAYIWLFNNISRNRGCDIVTSGTRRLQLIYCDIFSVVLVFLDVVVYQRQITIPRRTTFDTVSSYSFTWIGTI